MKEQVSEKDLEILVSVFESFVAADKFVAQKGNVPFVMDEAYINETIERIKSQYPMFSAITWEKLNAKIKSTFEFYQDEGEALRGNYVHEDWYPVEGQERRYWTRYYNWLKGKNPGFGSPNSKFDFNTDAITNLLGNPNCSDPFSVRGLVMGDVQSGKTATYIGIITKAVDAGYRVVILLTGMTESLRRQTQRRVDEGFIGFDSETQNQVGVGYGSKLPIPRAVTSTKTDYKGNANQNTAFNIPKDEQTPLVLVCKKNVSILTKVIKGLRSLNTSDNHREIDVPLLMIDDEADNASINTNKPDFDPTRINECIRRCLNLFRQSSYVGFTATPFANVFIQPTSPDEMEKDDLFPRDFIYSLKAPDNYIGPSSIFENKGKWHSSLVPLQDAFQRQDLFQLNHKKDWSGSQLFPSFYDSIITFCLANAVRDLRNDKNTHRSMLINMSRFIDVQNKIKEIVCDYFGEIRKSVKLFAGRNNELSNPTMARMKRVWDSQYENKIEFHWKAISDALFDAIKDIKVVVVNSKSARSLDYENNKNGLRVIAVGGLALSRGLTLEGLMTSYFYRNTSTYDVLMQMGRWFGYRPNYEDLIRIWIPNTSAEWYAQISEAIDLMRKDISTMIANKKKPWEFGVRVRNDSDDLGITARNKMWNTANRKESSERDFYGNVFENTFVTKDANENNYNWSLVNELSEKLPPADPTVEVPYYRNVSAENILALLRNVCIPGINLQFDKEQIVKFISHSKDQKLQKWDVIIRSFITKKKEDEKEENNAPSGLKMPPLKNGLVIQPIGRSCSEKPNGYAISGDSSHIGSRETKYGLTKEVQHQIEEERDRKGLHGTNQKMYMIPERNPLLIIYAIDPGKTIALPGDTQFLVAFSVAFPRTTDDQLLAKETHFYKVNIGADYYKGAGFECEGDEE